MRKNSFHFNLLESQYKDIFMHIVILCPSVKCNKAYQARHLIWSNPEVCMIDPGAWLHDWLWELYGSFRGESTLSELAFSGRHEDQSVWVLT